MMINKYIEDVGIEQVLALSNDEKLNVLREVDSVRVWGDRRWDQVNCVSVEDRLLWRVYEVNGRPVERQVKLRFWPLEETNKDILFDLDLRITGMFRTFKGVGVKRPSIVGYYVFFHRLFEREIADSYDGSPERWTSVNLVLSRLYSTARIATRYDQFDRFGPITRERDGDITFDYTRDVLASELVKRGLMKRKKAGR
jgi:hypothetical protein